MVDELRSRYILKRNFVINIKPFVFILTLASFCSINRIIKNTIIFKVF